MSVIEREERVEVTTADVLNRAADLLEEFGWCQQAEARNYKGVGGDALDPDVARFCIYGALRRAGIDLGAPRYFGWDCWDAMGLEGAPGPWNDEPGRTKAEVVAALRSAAEKANG